MHMRIARYRRAPGADVEELTRRVQEGLFPIFQRQPGFRGYIGCDSDETAIAISLFEDKAALDAAVIPVRAWATERLRDLLPDPPESLACRVTLADPASPAEAMRKAGACLLDEREVVEPPEIVRPLAQQRLIPALRREPGFIGMVAGRVEGDDRRLVSLQFWETLDLATRGAARVNELVAQLMEGKLPPPVRRTVCSIAAKASP
jgi:hypothetical protein